MARSSRGKAEGINAKQEFQGRSTHREQPHTESERADRVQRGDVRDRVGMREEESETENTREQERVDPRAQGNERAGMWKEIRGKAGSCERNEEREGERKRERICDTLERSRCKRGEGGGGGKRYGRRRAAKMTDGRK